MQFNFKSLLPHLIAIAVFVITLIAVFTPAFSGKEFPQGDIVQYEAMAKEITDYREKTGTAPNWTNSMFSGMPTYQLRNIYEGNFLHKLTKPFRGFLPHPAGMFFSAMLCAYLMFLILGINPWLSIVGALAFAFATNNVILFEAGHNNKIRAIAYFPLIIAGISAAFQSRYLLGSLVFALGMGMAIMNNHPQMVYYLGMTVPILGIALLVEAAQKKEWAHLGKGIGVLVIGLILAIGAGASNLLPTQEYAEDTMRGEPILAPPQAGNAAVSSSQTDGLEWTYAMNWSNGPIDLMATFIPAAAGGGSGEVIERSSPYGRALSRMGANLPAEFGAPTYHGNLPFTSGPIYLGAIIWFLFFLGALVVKGPLRWWLIGGTILTFLLSMGIEAAWFNRPLYDHLPLFNKWRAPSSALTITILLMAALGIMGVKAWQKLLDEDAAAARKSLFIAGGITGGFAIIMAIMGGSLFDFNAPNDVARIQQLLGGQGDQAAIDRLRNALVETRMDLLSSDAWRSFGLIALAFGALFLWMRKTISMPIAVAALGVLVLADFLPVNGRYFEKDDFVTERQYESRFQPSTADQQIMQDPDPHYRVFDVTSGDPFQNASPSYFHKSIGGYHAAKLQRYADLIDRYISQGNQPVLNMLNAKYYIQGGQNGPEARQNPAALGNAWLVSNIQPVPDNESEINALGQIDPATTAAIHQDFADQVAGLSPSGQGSISLTSYAPDKLAYNFNSSSEQLAVFSEIWYGPDKGWKAYIDGEEAPILRANYALRALRVPAGQHEVQMVFEPAAFRTGVMISTICSLLIIGGLLFFGYRNWKESQSAPATA